MPFSEVMAQERAVGSLRAALRRGTLHHAYLFGGPAGVGKGTAARLLAQAANCTGGPGGPDAYREDPCGACAPCRKIAAPRGGLHPDVLVLADERTMVKEGRWEPKGGRSPSREILVDQVRDLVDHRLSLRRFEGRRRVVIIDPADAMNVQAQNALLKTLEEPPDDTTLVLVSASPDGLLPTVRSRCLRVAFRPLPDEVVMEVLARERARAAAARQAAGSGRSGKPGKAARASDGSEDARDPEGRPSAGEERTAVALAGGSLGRALAFDAEAVHRWLEALRQAAALGPGDARAWLAFAAGFEKDREGAAELGELLLVWWRDVLAAQAGSDRLALADLAGETRRAAASLSPAEALRRRALAERMVRAVRGNATAPLAVERMLIGWFHGR